jgi:hypothetical protein
MIIKLGILIGDQKFEAVWNLAALWDRLPFVRRRPLLLKS